MVSESLIPLRMVPQRLGVGQPMIQAWLMQGEIEVVRVRSMLMVDREQVDQLRRQFARR